MRMWMTDPRTMCRKHLLGEHVEMHMFLGTLRKGISLVGYARNNLLDLFQIKNRHDALATEMQFRGYNHRSPMTDEELNSAIRAFHQPEEVLNVSIDRDAAKAELHRRCPECRALAELME